MEVAIMATCTNRCMFVFFILWDKVQWQYPCFSWYVVLYFRLLYAILSSPLQGSFEIQLWKISIFKTSQANHIYVTAEYTDIFDYDDDDDDDMTISESTGDAIKPRDHRVL